MFLSEASMKSRHSKVVELDPFSDFNHENSESLAPVDHSEVTICGCSCELCD